MALNKIYDVNLSSLWGSFVPYYPSGFPEVIYNGGYELSDRPQPMFMGVLSFCGEEYWCYSWWYTDIIIPPLFLQRAHGTCAPVSITQAFSASLALFGGYHFLFSAQKLIDCIPRLFPHVLSDMIDLYAAYEYYPSYAYYYLKHFGIPVDHDYPYDESCGTCVDIAPNVFISESYTILTTLRWEDMRSTLRMFEPLVDTFHAHESVYAYTDGIYMGRRDEGDAYLGTHAVLVTSCGCEERVPYLEIQNS